MKLRVFARLQKQTAGTTGYRLFDQDDATSFGYDMARAAHSSKNGAYDVDSFLIGLAILNRQKMKQMLDKKIIQAAIRRMLPKAGLVIRAIAAYNKHQKKKPDIKDVEAFEDWEYERDNLIQDVQDAANCNEYNPWPIDLTEPILLAYLSGYKVPPKLVEAFKVWVEFEDANGTRAKFIQYFNAFIKGIEKGKLDHRVLLSSSMLKQYLYSLEGGSSANFERELVLMGLSTKEEVKKLSFDKIIKRIVTEWKSK